MKVRCTVESMNYSPCGLEVGDYFEVDEEGLSLPPGKSFCFFAIASVTPLLKGRLDSAGAEDWLASRPLLACPDPPEALHMRLERIGDEEK
jgi:uncharacterized repeat protein (TIGR04076 family)